MVAFSLSLVSQLAAFITLCLEQGPNDGGGDDGNGGDEEEGDKLENVQLRFVRRKVRRVFRWWLRNIRLGDTLNISNCVMYEKKHKGQPDEK